MQDINRIDSDENRLRTEGSFIINLNKIDKRYKIAFASCFIWGIIAHGMAMTNKYSIHDDIASQFGFGDSYILGRWFLQLLDNSFSWFTESSHFSLPFIHVIFSLFFIALSLCLIVNLFDSHHNILIFLLSGVFAVFPSMTALFGYLTFALEYMLAFLMSTGGVFLLCRYKRWYSFIIGINLVTCAIGTYQAVIPYILSLILVFFIYHINNMEYKDTGNEWKDFFENVLWFGAACVCFMILYFIITRIELSVHRVVLSDYMGVSSMGRAGIRTYLSRGITAYKQFFNPIDLSNGKADSMFPMRIHTLYRFLVVVIILLSVTKLYHWREDLPKLIQMLLLMIFLPIAFEFIFVMAEPKDVHQLMVYGNTIIFVYLAWLLDNLHFPKENITKTIYVVCMITLLIMNILYCRYDNICYVKAEVQQQRLISYYNTLIANIKGTDGYRDEYPVAFVNAGHIQDVSLQDIPQFSEVRMMPMNGTTLNLVNDYTWLSFMNYWCGYSPVLADTAQFEDLPEVQGMPSWPDQGSIQVINGTVVVKF